MLVMLDGVFWSDDIGFVVDPQHMASSFPDAKAFHVPRFAANLKASERLPSLGPAPVASWLLARLFQLTRERLGFETHGRSDNDGGGWYVNFVAFSRDLRPAAFFNVHGDSAGVRVWGTCAGAFSPEAILKAFTDAILDCPNDVMVCKLTTIDTDPPDADRRRHGKPQLYGWDGAKFLGYRKRTEDERR